MLYRTRVGGVTESILDLRSLQTRDTSGRVENFLVQVRRWIARDADVVHLFEPHAGRFETVTNCLLGEARAVLDAIETLFLRRGDQSAVLDDCRRSIAVIRVDSENVHRDSIRYNESISSARDL